jgi:hypothetical protein
MISAKAAGRIIGACILGQMVGAGVGELRGAGFECSRHRASVNAAGHPLQMGLSSGARLARLCSVAIAIAALR